jgi:hypothetical protein
MIGNNMHYINGNQKLEVPHFFPNFVLRIGEAAIAGSECKDALYKLACSNYTDESAENQAIMFARHAGGWANMALDMLVECK